MFVVEALVQLSRELVVCCSFPCFIKEAKKRGNTLISCRWFIEGLLVAVGVGVFASKHQLTAAEAAVAATIVLYVVVVVV